MLKRITTLREVEEHWSLDDLLDANEAADLDEELEREAAKRRQEKP